MLNYLLFYWGLTLLNKLNYIELYLVVFIQFISDVFEEKVMAVDNAPPLVGVLHLIIIEILFKCLNILEHRHNN